MTNSTSSRMTLTKMNWRSGTVGSQQDDADKDELAKRYGGVAAHRRSEIGGHGVCHGPAEEQFRLQHDAPDLHAPGEEGEHVQQDAPTAGDHGHFLVDAVEALERFQRAHAPRRRLLREEVVLPERAGTREGPVQEHHQHEEDEQDHEQGRHPSAVEEGGEEDHGDESRRVHEPVEQDDDDALELAVQVRAVGVHAVELTDLVRQDHGHRSHLAVEGEVLRDADLLPVEGQEQAGGFERVHQERGHDDDRHLRYRHAGKERGDVPVHGQEHPEGDAQREDVHHAVFQQKRFHFETSFRQFS